MQWEIGRRMFFFDGPLFASPFDEGIEEIGIQKKSERLFLQLGSSWSTSRSVGFSVVRMQPASPAFNGTKTKNSNRWFIAKTVKLIFAMVEKIMFLTLLIDKAKVDGVELNVMAVICYSSCCFRTLLCTLCSAASQKFPQTQNPVTNNHIFYEFYSNMFMLDLLRWETQRWEEGR